MIRTADFDLLYEDIQFPFTLGEKTLFTLHYKGYRCHVDMFSTPEMDIPSPPLEEIKASGHRIGLTYSHPVTRKMPRISFHQGMICFAMKHFRRHYIDTSGAFEQYLERYKSKTLSTMRRKIKKLKNSCESGESVRIFTTPDEIVEFVEIAREISKKTFQYKLLNQGLQDGEMYMEDYLRKAEENRIVGLIIYAEDTPVAYNLCPIYGDGVMIYYYTGYDTEFRNYTPGTVLQFLTIETAFGLDQVNYYDFCAGEGEHKKLFTNTHKLCADMIYFPLTPRFLFVVLFKVSYEGLLAVIKYPLKKLGKADKIRKMIRRKAVEK